MTYPEHDESPPPRATRSMNGGTGNAAGTGSGPASGNAAATSPDLFLARRGAKGDAAAWETLVERFGEPIYNLALRFTRRPEEAEDLTQEVFLRLYNNLHRYRGDVPLLAWTLRLSRNLCIDHFRQGRARGDGRTVSAEVLDHLPAHEDSARRHEIAEQRRLVLSALDELTDLQAMVFTLREFHGLSYEEIAAFLEVPLGTVRSRLSRARGELVVAVERRMAADGGGARADHEEAR